MDTKRPTQYKRAREHAGLSLSQAARLMDVDLRELAHIENGDRGAAVWQQTAMEQAYGVSYGYLLTGVPYTFIDHLADGTPLEVAMKVAKRDGDGDAESEE